MKPDNIKPMDIYGLMYKMSKKYGKISANAGKTILQNVLNECVRWGLIERNPCKEVKRLKIEKEEREYLTDEQYNKLYEAASPLLRDVIDMAYETGCRIGDCLKIKPSDIKNNKLTVIQEKTGKKIVFDVQGDLAALINRIKSRKRILTTHLFSLNDGRPLKKDNFNHQFIALKKRIGLHGVIKFHDLRSKAGTDVQEQGGDAQ